MSQLQLSGQTTCAPGTTNLYTVSPFQVLAITWFFALSQTTITANALLIQADNYAIFRLNSALQYYSFVGSPDPAMAQTTVNINNTGTVSINLNWAFVGHLV